MRALLYTCLPLLLLTLVACAQKAPPQDTAATPQAATPAAQVSAPTQASVATPEEKCTTEPKTAPSDKRPRCGGMGDTTTASHAYRITLNGDTVTSCDITQPFSGKIGGGLATLTFTPVDAKNGSMTFHFANGKGIADTAYHYTLSGPEEKMTGSFKSASAICGQAAGLGACAHAKTQTFTSTWTRIDACKA